ncbi:hypothetical protein AWH62_02105 [Maricaulis sp. W15]|nr:hypothetical protein AWH62_02105 [Maricaulis sp. W15]
MSLTATPLAAATDQSPPSQIVRIHMNELESEAGRADVETRIRVAANRVCRQHGLRGLVAERIRRACFREAFTDGMSQLNRQYADTTSRTVAVVIAAQ